MEITLVNLKSGEKAIIKRLEDGARSEGQVLFVALNNNYVILSQCQGQGH